MLMCGVFSRLFSVCRRRYISLLSHLINRKRRPHMSQNKPKTVTVRKIPKEKPQKPKKMYVWTNVILCVCVCVWLATLVSLALAILFFSPFEEEAHRISRLSIFIWWYDIGALFRALLTISCHQFRRNFDKRKRVIMEQSFKTLLPKAHEV
jgi:hypothetical protein